MARTVQIWTGATDDTAAPPRVRLRVFTRCAGKCHRCGRKIRPGENWTLEHLVALINGGRNAEDNLGVTCGWCLPEKNAEDVAEKAKTYAVRSKHVLPRQPSRLRGPGFPPRAKQHTATRKIVRRSEQ